MEQMLVKASSSTLRMSARKTRIIVDLIRGKKVGDAIAILNNAESVRTESIIKVLNSAISNADHNYSLDVNKLFVKEVYVNEGAQLKRMRCRAKGSGNRILKRTCRVHITLAVLDK